MAYFDFDRGFLRKKCLTSSIIDLRVNLSFAKKNR